MTNISKIQKQIVTAIQNNETQYVSFDIFDTLLVRPCIKPTDIFHLIAEKVNDKYKINFVNIRQSAESKLKNPYASISDIYKFIAEEYNLDNDIATQLMNEEIETETALLYIREDVKMLYDEAIKAQKKIIAISDMYLPSDVLRKILDKNGYNNIEKIYVSNEYKARKDKGMLFDIVISDLKTNKIIHIGDNDRSDFKMPKKHKIKGFHYPKTIDILKKQNKIFKILINKLQKSPNRNRNIFIGYIINKYYFNSLSNPRNEKDLNTIIDMFLFPLLCFIAFSIQKNALIQTLYNKVYFAARDGYLPQKVYDILNSDKKYLESEYLYASRRAYMTGSYRNFFELFSYYKNIVDPQYTLINFLNATIVNETNKQKILDNLKTDEQKLSIKLNTKECNVILKRFETILQNEYRTQKENAIGYYKETFNKNRVVVFDVGYSGSISEGIQNLTGITVDKIYTSEKYKNILKDNKNKTYTYVIKNAVEQEQYKWLQLILEELCSPLTGSCAGFEQKDGKYIPKLDSFDCSTNMRKLFERIETQIINNSHDLINTFGQNLHYLNVTDILPIGEFITLYFIYNPKAKNIFSDVIFPDSSFRSKPQSLYKKVRIKKQWHKILKMAIEAINNFI